MQQSACGFHGPPYRPYQDVGQVELDDPSLILGGLGQKQDGQVHIHVVRTIFTCMQSSEETNCIHTFCVSIM